MITIKITTIIKLEMTIIMDDNKEDRELRNEDKNTNAIYI